MSLSVLHLAGSAVSDFLADLSLLYARDCLDATADSTRYDARLAYVSPDGRWRFPTDFGVDALQAADPMPVDAAIGHLRALRPDVVVPQMFCLPGMTTYRSLLDLLALPYVGNTAAVMALGADKSHTRSIVAAAGVPVPAAEVLRRGERPTLPPPVVVKPVDADNSLGVSLVLDHQEYTAALQVAFKHSERVLVETYVEAGREVRCAVLERDGELLCLPLEEYAVDAAHKPIRTLADKIADDGAGGLALVAKDSAHAWVVDPADPLTERVWDVARRSHLALGCRHYSLFDFRIDPDGRPWFLEAGLYCSFARKSVIAMMAEAAAMPVPDLFAAMIAEATLKI